MRAVPDIDKRSTPYTHNEFTAVFERDGEWYVVSPEIPGANGQGRTKEEAKQSLVQAIA